jgi:hypothetical protein
MALQLGVDGLTPSSIQPRRRFGGGRVPSFEGPVSRSLREEHLRAHSHIDAEQRATMPLPEEGQTISEIFKSGGPWQFEGERARLEYGHHVILRWALDTKALHDVSSSIQSIPAERFDCEAELAIVSDNGIFW